MSQLIKKFIEYIIKYQKHILTEEILTLFTFTIHNISTKKEYLIYFFLRTFRELNKL